MKTNKIRGFETVSRLKTEELLTFRMPRRSTSKSAGYDIYNNTGKDIILEPGELSEKIDTGLKSYMLDDEVLTLFPRSGHGFKYSVRLANTVGIIDPDFYDNPSNEGEMGLKLHNQGSKQLIIKSGEAMMQGIFIKYLITDDDADTVGGERLSGIGSTSGTW